MDYCNPFLVLTHAILVTEKKGAIHHEGTNSSWGLWYPPSAFDAQRA